MNTKTILTSHPTYEELFSYANNKIISNKSLIKHLESCSDCQREIDVINEMHSLLSSETTNVPNYFLNHHLSDATINEYVYGRLCKESQTSVEQHLQECTACLKEVLSFRTLLEERNNQKTSEIIRFNQKLSNKKRNQIGSLAIAASILLISFIYLMPNITNKNAVKEINNTPDILAHLPDSMNPSLPVMPVKMNGPGRIMVANGQVNWYGEYVETEAIGTVDMKNMANAIQAEILAEKTARANAYAQISEILGGVQVTQNSTYKDMLTQVDYLSVESQAFIRNAQVIEKDIKWINESPKVTIKMRVPLFGNNSLQSIIAPHLVKKDVTQQMQAQTAFQKDSSKSFAQYTGVVVDTRASNYKPAIAVNFETSNFSTNKNYKLNSDVQIKHYPEIEAIDQYSDTGNNPYIIKAKQLSNKGIIKLATEDMNAAAYILSRNQRQETIPVLY